MDNPAPRRAGFFMRTHCIALITDGDPLVSQGTWWEPMARAWPAGVPLPRFEPTSVGEVLATVESGKAARHWDAAVIALLPPLEEHIVCRVLDALQGAMVPAMLLV